MANPLGRYSRRMIAILGNFIVAVAHGSKIRVSVKRGDNSRQLARAPPVIAVQEGENLSTRDFNSCVECRNLTAILLANKTDERPEFVKQLGRRISRAIIDDYDLGLAS